MVTELNGNTIHKGDTEWISVELSNRAGLFSNNPLFGTHPLFEQGLQTPGYTTKFCAKQNFCTPFPITVLEFDLTIASPDLAYGKITPEMTNDLIVPCDGLLLRYEVQVSDGTEVFTIEGGAGDPRTFKISNDLILGV